MYVGSFALSIYIDCNIITAHRTFDWAWWNFVSEFAQHCAVYKICESNGKSLHVVYLFLYGVYIQNWNLELSYPYPLPLITSAFSPSAEVLGHRACAGDYHISTRTHRQCYVMLGCCVRVCVCECVSVCGCAGALWGRLVDELRRSLQMSLEW